MVVGVEEVKRGVLPAAFAVSLRVRLAPSAPVVRVVNMDYGGVFGPFEVVESRHSGPIERRQFPPDPIRTLTRTRLVEVRTAGLAWRRGAVSWELPPCRER
jgi:hypothetical protein